MTHLMKQTLAALFFVILPGLVHANCDLLTTAEIPADQLGQVGAIQNGLQAAMQDDNALLQDGKFGAYTRVTLVQFCTAFPLADGVDTLTGTLNAARAYDALADLRPDWYGQTSVPAFSDKLLELAADSLNLTTLSLAGPTQLSGAILNGSTGTTDHCDSLQANDLPADAATGAFTLTIIDGDQWPDIAAICRDIAAPGGSDGTIAALTSFGTLEARLPGSLLQVMSPDFTLWLGEQIATRGPRLVGDDNVVAALVAEYRAENRPGAKRDFSPIYDRTFAACGQSDHTGITEFTGFEQVTLESFAGPVDVPKLLEPLTEETFSSRAALRTAIFAALDGQISACLREQISAAIESSDNFGNFYALNAEQATNLALVGDFADAAPVVPELIGKSAQSQTALLSGVRSMIQTATKARIDAEIELAAETLAAAAEPVDPFFDSLPPGLEDQIEPLTLTPTIGVTEATDSAILATVADTDFQKALLAAAFLPAPNAEVLKGNVRDVLTPIAAQKLAASVNRDMARLLAVVESPWGLTPDLQSAIAAAPAVTSVDFDPAVIAALQGLVGVQYPNNELFEIAVRAAVADLELADKERLVSEVRASAQRSAPDLNIPRQTHVALPDCGCVRRRDGDQQVYGFFPFWKAPELTPVASVEGAETVDDETYLIDFGLVGRAAFYGIEILTDANASPDTVRVSLRNDRIWEEGGWDFINAAHQHRAKADLAIRINGWQSWQAKDINDTARQIVGLLEPFRGLGNYAWRDTPRAYETMIDGLWGGWQVDGLTLEVPGYDATQAQAPNISNLITLITLIKQSAVGQRIDVNLAFDLKLTAEHRNTPLFGDIKDMLVGGDDRSVEHVLVWLQQPTTDSKKQLRLRMDLGGVQGAERAEILDNILPVVPGGGHRLIRTTRRDPLAAPAPEFSQFKDDLVYFRQNFGGVGFWPIPDPDNIDNIEMVVRVDDTFDPHWRQSVSHAGLDSVCAFVCPNRAYVATFAAILFIITTLVVWRAFYSGLAHKFAYDFKVAWATGGLFFIILLAMSICDPFAIFPPIFLTLMVLGMLAAIVYRSYQTAQHGPKP